MNTRLNLMRAAAVVLSVSLAWASETNPQTTRTDPAQASVKPAKTKFVVPFEMLPTNHMLVEARINGKGPYHLIFDLGAPITLLSNRASEAAGVVKADAPRSFLFSMRGEAEVDKLQVGELTAAKLPVIVFDHPVLGALGDAVDRRIDGIMGFTFFARYKTTIDYQAHKMTFESVDFKVRDLLKDLPDRLMGPKVTRRRVLAPLGVWGLRLGEPTGVLDSPGVAIAAVEGGSPAHRAGLKPGDVLTSLDGRWTTSIADVFHAAADVEPGRATAVVILRDGKEQTLTITPADGA
jgi:membrane-associated protease RseP (regulator of RpoE activity)